MKRVDLSFLLLGSIMLVLGVILGVYMGATHDLQFAPMHAHVNLVGWASLALFGLTYRAYPEMAESRLAAVHLALAGPAAILFPIGIYLAVMHERPALAIAAALIWLVGSALFVFQLARQTLRNSA